ncbi:MAG: 3-dehydroquinate synthase [Legionella sp.]|uniref:3-dehydroquinate synthase n=1 Tax=Legionella sp. TaxID=459 RepID=UPI0039E4AB1E
MANFKTYGQVNVSFTGHHYSISICRHGLSCPELLQAIVKSPQVLIVTNQTIAPLYLKKIQSTFSGIQCDAVILKDGEHYKNQDSLFTIYDALIQYKHHRDTTIIALGGGVIGDLAGFAAATYQRGVGFIQIPTTLLAQVDASVGGKTAINHAQGKNIIGSFYQPDAVFIDVATLDTLPEREFRAGIAEMIKYGLLAGGEFLKELHQSLNKGLTANSPQLPYLITQCCQIKAQFVERDEKEKGQRALLNLGHTFAHALEAYTHYQHWLHGEAVAIGLYCASVLSEQIGLINKKQVAQIEQMLQNAGLPHKIPETINLHKLRELMSLDKKIKNNCLRFVLIKELGCCYLDDQITEKRLHKALIAAVEGE